MQKIIVTGATDAPPSEVEARLNPESIIEYAGIYDINDSETIGDKRVIDVWLERRNGKQLEVTYEFTELEDGYVYTQRGGAGPFEEMWTTITVEGDSSGTKIEAHGEFTFGGLASFIIDRLAAGYRQRELEQIVSNLVVEAEDGGTLE